MYADLFRPISLCSFSTCQLVYAYLQGVVTYMSCVEAFATGIKIESSDQSPLGGQSRDQGDLQTAKNQRSRTCSSNVTFDPWKSSDQEPQKGTIKRSSTLFADHKTWSRSQTLLQAAYKWLPLDLLQANWSMLDLCWSSWQSIPASLQVDWSMPIFYRPTDHFKPIGLCQSSTGPTCLCKSSG